MQYVSQSTTLPNQRLQISGKKDNEGFLLLPPLQYIVSNQVVAERFMLLPFHCHNLLAINLKCCWRACLAWCPGLHYSQQRSEPRG